LSLVIVGSIGLDSISTPAGEVCEALGGSAIYGSLAASHFTNTHIVGVVGKDIPVEYLNLLQKSGINLDGLEVKDGKTFRWKGKYSTWNRVETLSTDLNVFADFSPQLPESCKCCRSLLLANIHPALQLQVLNQVSGYSHLACDTMNYWIELCPEEVEKVLKRVDIVFMNEDEIRDYTKIADIYSAAYEILSLGPKWVIVKRGECGSVAVSKDDMYFAPAYPVKKVKDPTGAGDSFAGAFMGYLADHDFVNHALIKEAILYGTVLAAMNVSDFSVQGLVGKSMSEIDNYKDRLIKWTS
jgi:sugar/nucleoside kinase (ribokinase family)